MFEAQILHFVCKLRHMDEIGNFAVIPCHLATPYALRKAASEAMRPMKPSIICPVELSPQDMPTHMARYCK